jgi:hypothetical protein
LRVQASVPTANAAFWKDIENPQDREDRDREDEPLQYRITKLLNSHELKAIAALLQPWPLYAHAFNARTHKTQDHVSWPINPKTRAMYNISMLSDAEFSRTIAIAIIHPIMEPRICSCGQAIDPAGFHLLHCHYNHYTQLHNVVKFAVAGKLRSLMNAQAAAFSIAIEPQMNTLFPLRDPHAPEGIALVADLALSLHTDLQQHPIACDFVSCFSSSSVDWTQTLAQAARIKRKRNTTNIFAPIILSSLCPLVVRMSCLMKS